MCAGVELTAYRLDPWDALKGPRLLDADKLDTQLNQLWLHLARMPLSSFHQSRHVLFGVLSHKNAHNQQAIQAKLDLFAASLRTTHIV